MRTEISYRRKSRNHLTCRISDCVVHHRRHVTTPHTLPGRSISIVLDRVLRIPSAGCYFAQTPFCVLSHHIRDSAPDAVPVSRFSLIRRALMIVTLGFTSWPQATPFSPPHTRFTPSGKLSPAYIPRWIAPRAWLAHSLQVATRFVPQSGLSYP